MTAATSPPQRSGPLREELERLAATLKPAQRKVLAELAADGSELSRADYERVGLVSRSQAAYDLAELVQMGLLERVGSGRATQYRLARAGGGRKRRWTEERIRAELESFCAERMDWPRALDFKEAGRGDLYLAASRYGGIDHWASELGFEEPDEPSAPRRRGLPSLPVRRWAGGTARAAAGSALALGLVLAGGLALRSDAPEPRSKARSAASQSPAPLLPPASPAEADVVSAAPQAPVLRIRAARGPSWVSVRRESAAGRVLFAGTLERGQAVRFRGRRFWIRLGAPWNVDARLGSHALALRRTRTGIVTTRGLRAATRIRPIPVRSTPPPPPASAQAVAASVAAAPPPPAPVWTAPPAASPPAAPPPAAPAPAPAQPARPAPDEPPGSGPGPDPPPGP